MNDAPGRSLKQRREKPYQAVRRCAWFVLLMLGLVASALWLVIQIQQFVRTLVISDPFADSSSTTFITPIVTERIITPEGVMVRYVDEDYGMYCLGFVGRDPDCTPMQISEASVGPFHLPDVKVAAE